MSARAAIFASLLALCGCGRILGGGCDEGWVPRPGACDAGAAADVTTTDTVDAGAAHDALDVLTDDVPDARADAASDVSPMDVPADVAPADVLADVTDVSAPQDVARPCTPPEHPCNGVCVDLTADPMNCGACGVTCGAGRYCVGGTCGVLCAPPRILCAGACVDPESDPEHCGRCGNVCPTGLCNGGRCRDERAGHLVLIGHDLEATRPDQGRLVGNAVFLTAASSPRLVLFTAWARAQSVDTVEAAVRTVAGPRLVRATRVSTGEALESVLSVDSADVVLIPHQVSATDAQVTELARRVSNRMVAFARAGGVVVVLDGEGSNGGTWPFAERTALIAVSGHRGVTGSATELVNGADAIAIGLSSAYRAERSSVGFTGTDGRGVVVRCDGLPLAIHEVVFR